MLANPNIQTVMPRGPVLAVGNPAKTPNPLPEVGGLILVLPSRLTEKFGKADDWLREQYGESPGVPALALLWLACATPLRIEREFELGVLDIKRHILNPDEEAAFDEDCL